MKKIMLSLLTSVLMLVISSASAQKVKLKEGDLSILKGITKMNVRYDYSNMAVGKFTSEAEYIEKKKADYNSKEAGKGDRWEKSWKADRERRFQPQFEELFYKYSKIELGDYPSEKYTLVLKTTFTEPGFNIYVTRKNALINAEVWIEETARPGHALVRIAINKSPGRTFGGYDYDTGERIEEAYAAAGKALAKFLK